MSWPEFEEALSLSGQLVAAELGGSLAYRVLRHARTAYRVRHWSSSPLGDLRWRSQLNYDVERNLRVGPAALPARREVREWLVAMTDEKAATLSVAAMLALYRLR